MNELAARDVRGAEAASKSDEEYLPLTQPTKKKQRKTAPRNKQQVQKKAAHGRVDDDASEELSDETMSSGTCSKARARVYSHSLCSYSGYAFPFVRCTTARQMEGEERAGRTTASDCNYDSSPEAKAVRVLGAI